MAEESVTVKKHKFNLSFLKKIKDFKHIKTIVVVILSLIVAVIFLSSFKTKSSKSEDQKNETTLSALEYCKQQENRLESVLANVKGIKNVKVFVMVEESPEIVYLTDKTERKTGGETTGITTTAVVVRNGSITNCLVVVEKLPKIVGVMVIANGAGDLKMKTTLTNTISSVLGVNISNVEVMEGK